MSGRWGGRDSAKAGARDFEVGQISSSELASFRKLPPEGQREIIKLLEKVNFYRNSNPEMSRQYHAKLKDVEKRLGV